MKSIRNIAPALVVPVLVVGIALVIGLASCGGQAPGGQAPEAVPTEDTNQNTALSNDELVSKALENMADLEKYGVELVAVEPANAIAPTSHFTLTGYEQPGKGMVLTARGTNSVSTYSIVSIEAMTAAEFPYEMIVAGEDMYISADRGNTWQLMSGQAAGYFIPPTILLCSWGTDPDTVIGEADARPIASCADMLGNTELEDGVPREEVVNGVPTRHLTGDLMAVLARSSESFMMPYVHNDSPEALALHAWISTDATPRVLRMRLDLTSSQQTGEGVNAPFIAVGFSPDGKYLVGAHMGSSDMASGPTVDEPLILVWDLTKSDSPPLALRAEYRDTVWHVAFSPDGKYFAATSSRKVYVWETANLAGDAKVLTIPGDVSLASTAFSADSKMLGVAGSSGGIYVCDRPFEGTPRLAVADPAGSLAFSADGRTLATSGADGVRLYSLDDLKAAPRVLNAPEAVPPGEVHYRKDALAFSPNGQLFAVSRDPDGGDAATGQIDVWDLRSSEKPLATLQGSGGVVAFSPDGKYLAAEGGQIWEVAHLLSDGSNASPKVIEGICGNAPAFSADSRKLAVACYESQVQVWDLSNLPDAGSPTVFLRDPADANKLTYSIAWTWSRFNDDSIQDVQPPAPEKINQP